MLTTLFKLSGIEIDRDLAEYIAFTMNDNPFHMQLFGYYLVNEGKITPETIEKLEKR